MLITSRRFCMAFLKRIGMFCTQNINWNCVIYQAQLRGFSTIFQQTSTIKNRPLLLMGKVSLMNCCSKNNIRRFYSLSIATTFSTRLFYHNIFRFWNKTGYCRQRARNILQKRDFSQHTGKISGTNPAVGDEHWGPYLLSKIHNLEESSRFHGYSILRWGLSIAFAILTSIYLFRDELRENVADEVADVASRSMADENVVLKAHGLTKGVLEKLMSETDTIALVSEFLKRVLQRTEVRNTAVAFAVNTLYHPQTREKLQEVVKNTLHSILNDEETKALLLEFIKSLIEDPKTKETCNMFLQSLTKDPDIQKIVTEFFKSVLASPSFQMEAIMLGREVTHRVVRDKDIQKQTGDALWSAVKHGVTPYWFRGEK